MGAYINSRGDGQMISTQVIAQIKPRPKKERIRCYVPLAHYPRVPKGLRVVEAGE